MEMELNQPGGKDISHPMRAPIRLRTGPKPGATIYTLLDGLETATHLGFTGEEPLSEPLRHKLKIWEEISSRLNELNRSLGVTDHYHFSVNELVAEKLEFVETFIQELQTSGLMQGVGQKLS